jgi:hypothetical protein
MYRTSCRRYQRVLLTNMPLLLPLPPSLSIARRTRSSFCSSSSSNRRRGGVWRLALIPLSLLVARRTFVEYQHYGFGGGNNHNRNTTTVHKHMYTGSPRPHVHYVVTIPIDVQLSGEFGNHLSKIASAIAVAYELHQRSNSSSSNISSNKRISSSWNATTAATTTFEFRAEFRLHRQEGHSKGAAAVQMLNECFSTLVAVLANRNHSMTEAMSSRSSAVDSLC